MSERVPGGGEGDALPEALVVCTGNSCRSQMAEAFLRELGRGRLVAHSAGAAPASEIHPLTLEVMEEVGIDLSGQRPKALEPFLDRSLAWVIVVCDRAAASCPVWPGPAERLTWPFDDPAAATGDRAQRLERFRSVRDAIRGRIEDWLAELPRPTVD